MKRKNDIILIAAALVLALGFWLWTSLGMAPGAEAVVSIDGVEVERLPLDQEAERLYGQGEHSNTLVITGGKARITAASCPDHVCMERGDIDLEGETIVCLPNKLVVSIVGGDESVDGMAG